MTPPAKPKDANRPNCCSLGLCALCGSMVEMPDLFKRIADSLRSLPFRP